MSSQIKLRVFLFGTPYPLEGIRVHVTNLVSGLQYDLHTDYYGDCAFTMLPDGVYEIKIHGAGFETETRVIKLVDNAIYSSTVLLKQSIPACDKAPDGWQCTRGVHDDGPCAAEPVTYPIQKTKDQIIDGLDLALARAVKDQVYGFFLDGPPTFVQGDQAGEVCDLITAKDLNRWFGKDADTFLFTRAEMLILQKLLRGYVVGPDARKVLDKINAVKEG